MYCIHCGKQIEDSAKFCMYCGKQVGPATEETAAQPSSADAAPDAGDSAAQSETPSEPVQNDAPQAAAPAAEPVSMAQPAVQTETQGASADSAPQLGMRWAQVVPFLLGIGVIWSIVQLFQVFSMDAPLSLILSLPTIGPAITCLLVGAIVSIVLAVLAIVFLVKHKKWGYYCLYGCYAVEVVAGLITLIAYSSLDLSIANPLATVITGALMLVVNIIYFKKRQHLYN